MFFPKLIRFGSPNIRPSHGNHVVGGFLAFLEDIGHAEGIAHLNEPITQGCGEAILDAVEAAFFPRRDELLFPSAFYFFHFIAADAKSDLWPDA